MIVTDLEPVIIRWQDARSQEEWTSRNGVDYEPHYCETVGWLYQETDDSYTVVRTDGADLVEGGFIIPRGCVLEIVYLLFDGRNRK